MVWQNWKENQSKVSKTKEDGTIQQKTINRQTKRRITFEISKVTRIIRSTNFHEKIGIRYKQTVWIVYWTRFEYNRVYIGMKKNID